MVSGEDDQSPTPKVRGAAAEKTSCCGAEESPSTTRNPSVARLPIRSEVGLSHNPNTYSTRALRCSLSSGVLTSLLFAEGLGPDTISTYRFPPVSKVMGGAEKPDPTLIFHSSPSVDTSNAATVPSSSARKIRPPPVARVPLSLG